MKPGEVVRHPLSLCLGCGKKLDAGFAVGGERGPRPGDFILCGYCGHLMVFTEDLGVREPNDAEILEIAGDPRLVMASKALQAMKKDKS